MLQHKQPNMNESIAIEDLKDYFECPICFCVPKKPPIYQCGKGHLLCSTCRPKISRCPICRTKLDSESRLYFAERLLEERVPVPCKYEEDGCEEEHLMLNLWRHEEKCPYSPVACHNAHLGCRTRPRMKYLLQHLCQCDYRLIKCPLVNCGEEILFKLTERHLKEQHFAPVAPFGHKTAVALLILLMFSIFMNFLCWKILQNQF